MNKDELKNFVLDKAKDGIIIFKTVDGFMASNLEEFIKQPAQGILYDLNRDEVTILSYMDDPKWVNDYAVSMVIKKLKEYYDKYQEEHKNNE